jgi:hypothetical protein
MKNKRCQGVPSRFAPSCKDDLMTPEQAARRDQQHRTAQELRTLAEQCLREIRAWQSLRAQLPCPEDAPLLPPSMYRRCLRDAAGLPLGRVTTLVYDAHNRLFKQVDSVVEAPSLAEHFDNSKREGHPSNAAPQS